MVTSIGTIFVDIIVYTLDLQSVYTAFYALYVTKERCSSVQAMQSSNGLTDPIGLWLGHLMFDVIWSIILSSIIIIIFATVSNQFHGLGFFVRLSFFFFSLLKGIRSANWVIFQWVVLILYGFAGALFSYCISLIVTSPLAAFAAAAGYQFVISVVSLFDQSVLFFFDCANLM